MHTQVQVLLSVSCEYGFSDTKEVFIIEVGRQSYRSVRRGAGGRIGRAGIYEKTKIFDIIENFNIIKT